MYFCLFYTEYLAVSDPICYYIFSSLLYFMLLSVTEVINNIHKLNSIQTWRIHSIQILNYSFPRRLYDPPTDQRTFEEYALSETHVPLCTLLLTAIFKWNVIYV